MRYLFNLFTVCAMMFAHSVAHAGDCNAVAPPYTPITETFEATCTAGKTIVDIRRAKSPVVKLNFAADQEITISTHSGARSSGGNGRNTQVCIWQSWDSARPCGVSLVSQEGYNDWDGKATCSIKVPRGVQYVRAFQYNVSADELNTTMVITCLRTGAAGSNRQ